MRRFPVLFLSVLSTVAPLRTAAAQTGPFVDGELVVRTTVNSQPVIYRIDPETGHGAALIHPQNWGGWAGSMAYDSYRDGLLCNMSLPPNAPFAYKLWLVRHDGTAAAVPGLDGQALRALCPAGDGRVYFQRHPSATNQNHIEYLDASNAVHTLLDASGAAPLTFQVEHLIYHAASNALIATTSPWWSTNLCSAGHCSVFRLPLNPGGTRIAGSITCASLATSNENVMSVDQLASGQILVTLASGASWTGKLAVVDPVTLALSYGPQVTPNDLDGGCFSARLGRAVVLDDGANVLRSFDGSTGAMGSVLATDVAVSDGTSGLSPVDSMIEIDRLGPGCTGFTVPYGAGLAGTGGLVPRLFAIGCPDVLQPFTIACGEIRGGTNGVLAVSAAKISLPLWGGTLLVDPAAGFLLPLTASGPAGAAGAGAVFLPLLISDPGFDGLSFFLQGAFADPAASQGFTLSNGLRITIG